MFEYLLKEVFITPESKATGFSIMVSSVMAILVIFINKRIVDSREAKKQKIMKLEEVALFLSELQLLGTKYIDGIDCNNEEFTISSASEMAQIELTLNKIESLLTLHFSKNTFFDKRNTLEILRNARVDFVQNRTIYQMSKSHEAYKLMIDYYWSKLHEIMRNNQ